MDTTQNSLASDHQEVTLLLPWYINNTLSGNELTHVRQHLSHCPICQQDVIFLQHLAKATPIAPTKQAPPPSFNTLKVRLTNSQPLPTATVTPITRKPHKWAWFIPLGLAASAILLAFTLAQHFRLPHLWQDSYQTLSSDKTVLDPQYSIRVIFTDNLTQSTINQLLIDSEAYVVAGPNERSVYTLGFRQIHDATGLAHKLAQLRHNQHIIFAELGNTSPIPVTKKGLANEN
jgi:Putative zinc-finger